MINVDSKKGILEYGDDIDVIWEDIKELLIPVLALSEYCEDKDYIKTQIQKIRSEYEEARKKIIENLIDTAAQNEKDDKLPCFDKGELDDLLHI